MVLRGLEAFNDRDIEGISCRPIPSWCGEEGSLVFPDLPPTYHGHDGLRRRWQEAIVDAWESFTPTWWTCATRAVAMSCGSTG